MGENMSSSSNIVKMLVGIIIFIIGVAWYVPKQYYGIGFLDDLLTLLGGTIGLVLLFVGLIVAWMGYDDYKMDAEMAKEEKKEEVKKE